MLEPLLRAEYRSIVYRLAGRRAVAQVARQLGLDGDDLSDFVNAVGDEATARILCSDPFKAKSITNMPPFGWPTRFSDGSYPVFYAAEERKTAEVEVAYHRRVAALNDPSNRLPMHMWVFYCAVEARAIDLRERQIEWPWMVSDETCNADCLLLGREAVGAGDVDCFQAPSARHEGGTTVPVFHSRVLSDPVIEGTTVFTFDEATAKISLRHHEQGR